MTTVGLPQEWLQVRYAHTDDASLSLIFARNWDNSRLIHSHYAIEDEPREEKVAGETRIPAGRYEVKLRTEGGMHARYKRRFGHKHVGMLHLQNVPGFEWIYIHPGNTDDDTEGCICPGLRKLDQSHELRVLESRSAYWGIYNAMAAALYYAPADEKRRVWWQIVDMDMGRFPEPEVMGAAARRCADDSITAIEQAAASLRTTLEV